MLQAEVSRFDSEVHALAWQLVRAIVEQEHARRVSEQARKRPAAKPTRAAGKKAASKKPAGKKPAGKKPAGKKATGKKAAGKPASAASKRQLELTLPAQGSAQTNGAPAVRSEVRGKGSARWTRESVVDELVRWLVSGTSVDAAFLTRHGPRGLVAAARRIFGRFDAALNVAALEIARLYPEGPPQAPRAVVPRRKPATAPSAPPQPSSSDEASAAAPVQTELPVGQ